MLTIFFLYSCLKQSNTNLLWPHEEHSGVYVSHPKCTHCWAPRVLWELNVSSLLDLAGGSLWPPHDIANGQMLLALHLRFPRDYKIPSSLYSSAQCLREFHAVNISVFWGISHEFSLNFSIFSLLYKYGQTSVCCDLCGSGYVWKLCSCTSRICPWICWLLRNGFTIKCKFLGTVWSYLWPFPSCRIIQSTPSTTVLLIMWRVMWRVSMKHVMVMSWKVTSLIFLN